MFEVLVVEDDQRLRQLICTVLMKNGYSVTGTENGEAALEVLDRKYIDIIISDIMMSGMDGYELIKTLRESNCNLPILIITAKERFNDKQKGFLCGADDYMVKPIDINEMVLRVGALLRRAKIISERKMAVGEVVLDCDSLTVIGECGSIELPQKEFHLLYKLLSFPDKIFTRRHLMDEIWGMDSETCERTVDVHINRLRDHFKDYPWFEIVTVRGLGYKAVKKTQ